MGKEKHLKKASTFGTMLILLLALLSASPTLGSHQTNRGDILYVGGSGPGNYTTIQGALDAADPGDTVYVYAGTYDEHLEIHTTLSLLGQDRDTTIIDGNNNGTDVNITADQVNISGFTIQGSGPYGNDAGISVRANHSSITDMVITGANNGILIGSLSRNAPHDSLTFTNDRHRKETTASRNNTITHTILSHNSFGVFLPPGETMDTVNNNTFLHNAIGVIVSSGSSHIVLVNNTFQGDGLLVLNESYANTVTGNTVNGEPLLYVEGQSDLLVTEDQGQVILVRCHNVTVTDQDITDVCVGAQLIDTDHGYISGNTLSSNSFVGLFTYHSDDMTIEDNMMTSNRGNGIEFWGNNATITSNTVSNNNQTGIYLYHSNHAIIKNNTLSGNGFGIELDTSEGNTLIEGNDIQRGYGGISLYQNRDTMILNNNMLSCHDNGIILWVCNHTRIMNNTITNQSWGMMLQGSINGLVSGNTITDNVLTAMIIGAGSSHNTIVGNTIRESTGGIDISSSMFNTVSGNTVASDGSGASVFYSYDTMVADNTFTLNPQWDSTIGVGIAYTDNSTIAHNTIVNATIGIMQQSSRTTLRDNTIAHCPEYGILCFAGSNQTTLQGNTITECGTGILLDRSDAVTLIFDTVRNSTGTGISIESCDDLVITNDVIRENQDGIQGTFTSYDTLRENDIENNRGTGIFLTEANHNMLDSNVIDANTVGINISGDSNTVTQNLVAHSTLGITIYRFAQDNSVYSNNFVNNTKHAGFVGYISYGHNKWTHNFWGKARWLPYPIIGTMDFDGPFSLTWPWVAFDWNPAKHPTMSRTT